MSKNEWKIEAKPSIYHIFMENGGSYSDYREKNDFICANSPEEAWELYKRYCSNNRIILNYDGDEWVSPAIKRKTWEDELNTWWLEISPLKVIHFQNLRGLNQEVSYEK